MSNPATTFVAFDGDGDEIATCATFNAAKESIRDHLSYSDHWLRDLGTLATWRYQDASRLPFSGSHIATGEAPEDERAFALAVACDIKLEDVSECSYGSDSYDADGGEYWVATDSEADERWEEYLDSYIDDCVLPDLEEQAQFYFDRDAWKRDARHDGRGHSLNSWDGAEECENVNGTDYYIYRTN